MLKSTDGLPLTHEACLPLRAATQPHRPFTRTACHVFTATIGGVLRCLQHPGRWASLVFRPLLLRGGLPLSAGYDPALTGVLYIPFPFGTWACGCITRGARHNPPSQCHTWLAVFPSAQPTKALANVRSTAGEVGKQKALATASGSTPSGQRGGSMSKGSYLSGATPTD